MSPQPCTPFSRHRSGISIGEAAGLFIATRAEDGLQPPQVSLTGASASSDAYHMSAPHPEGQGAIQAMRGALNEAGVKAEQLGYINLHGTATPLNDKMEAHALQALQLQQVPASSTKAMTGHTLGAAGAIEAVMCWLALTNNQYPLHAWDGEYDPELAKINLCTRQPEGSVIRHCLSNSFAFGGNNVSLVFSKG